MPYRYVEPETFTTLPSGETVYRMYRLEMLSSPLVYHYQIPSDDSDSGWMAFDIRNLKYAQNLKDIDLSHKEIMRMAIKTFAPTLEGTLIDLDAWYNGTG